MTATDDWGWPVTGQEMGFNFAELGDGVRLFDVRGAWSDTFGNSGPVEKIGYAVHHAVTGTGDGSLVGDLAIIEAIHTHHTQTNGWPGIGYHRIIGGGRRIYMIAGSASQRAHVANLNHQWIGWCFLGTWTHQRPDEDHMAAFLRGVQWETDQRQVPMLLAPHKRLTPGTECPGGWTAQDSWQGTVLQPSAPAPPALDPFQAGRKEMYEGLLAHIESLRIPWGIP